MIAFILLLLSILVSSQDVCEENDCTTCFDDPGCRWCSVVDDTGGDPSAVYRLGKCVAESSTCGQGSEWTKHSATETSDVCQSHCWRGCDCFSVEQLCGGCFIHPTRCQYCEFTSTALVFFSSSTKGCVESLGPTFLPLASPCTEASQHADSPSGGLISIVTLTFLRRVSSSSKSKKIQSSGAAAFLRVATAFGGLAVVSGGTAGLYWARGVGLSVESLAAHASNTVQDVQETELADSLAHALAADPAAASGGDEDDAQVDPLLAPPALPSHAAEADSVIRDHFKYIIVGAGAAGFHALQAIRELDPDGAVLVVSEEAGPPYMRPPLSKELWRRPGPPAPDNGSPLPWTAAVDSGSFENWQGQQTSIYLPHDEQSVPLDAHTTWKLGSRATDLDADVRALMLSDGSIVYFDKLLIATGAKPQLIPGISKRARASGSVTTFRTVDDFYALDRIARAGGRVAVVGGSFLGSELAAALAGTRSLDSVVQVFPESNALSLHIPSYLADRVTGQLRDLGVDVRPETAVTSIDLLDQEEDGAAAQLVLRTSAVTDAGDQQQVQSSDQQQVQSSPPSSIVVDHVVVCAGARPSLDLALEADLEIDEKLGGLAVNSEYQTSRSDIYAAGDAASFYCPVLGRRRVEHFDHAVASGRRAGLNMAGQRGPCAHLPMFWGDIGALGFEAVGRIDASLPSYGVFDSTHDDPYGRGLVYYMDEDRIVGVLAWGLFDRMDDARSLLKRRKLIYDKRLLSSLIAFEDQK